MSGATVAYTTPAEAAAKIRQALKRELGATSRDISVRASSFSMGSAVDVTIRDPRFSMARVRAIAEQEERIHRCEITGDILGGGNRFIGVTWSREAEEILARRFWDALERLEIRGTGQELDHIEGAPEHFWARRISASIFELAIDGHSQRAYSVREAALLVALNAEREAGR